MNTTNLQEAEIINRMPEMIEAIMSLHRCEDCPIRCRAIRKPHSIFARLHRWHKNWWPGWKIYMRELHSRKPSATA